MGLSRTQEATYYKYGHKKDGRLVSFSYKACPKQLISYYYHQNSQNKFKAGSPATQAHATNDA